jgi:hypothetical protein
VTKEYSNIDDLKKDFFKAMSNGLSYRDACAAVGIKPHIFFEGKKVVEVREEFDEETRLKTRITIAREARPHWTDSARFLEERYPEDYGPNRAVESKGKNTSVN